MEFSFKFKVSQFLKTAQGFRVVKYLDINFKGSEPHFYIFIRIPEEDNFLTIIITSQIEKRTDYYRKTHKPIAAECMVRVDRNILPCLSLPSVIECNQAQYLTREKIVHLIDESAGFNHLRDISIPVYLRHNIISAILKSPILSNEIKKKAKLANSER